MKTMSRKVRFAVVAGYLLVALALTVGATVAPAFGHGMPVGIEITADK